MMHKVKQSLFGLTLFLLLGLSHVVLAANSVSAVRVWPAQDYTRITLEANTAFTYKMTAMQNPDRVVLDIENVELNQTLKSLADKVQVSDPYIKQIRSANSPQGIRLVVDLKAAAKPSAFTLTPTGAYKYRLVLDIHPLVDPLMAMVAERDAAIAPANATLPAATEPNAQPTTVLSPSEMAAPEVQAAAPAGTALSEAVTLAPEQPIVKALPPEVKKTGRLIVVAIDAGHGGEDPGASGASGSREKDITLMVAKKLKQFIDAEPNMRAVLTRDGDYFIPLHGRVVKARSMQADLFLSIHADAFTKQSARGSSVFALSERGATSASARYLAKKENESDLIGGVSLDDKDPILARTLLDLSQTATINDSLKLGKAVLGEIGEINTLHAKRVEQAAFAVLKSPDIPSILIETAFISNPEEERRLNDEAYQDQLCAAILDGIKTYFSTNPALAKSKLALE